MRKLLNTLLSMLILAPAAALALGLGNVTLHSSLNQPLDAEIELLSVSPGELASLQVSLPDAKTFSRLGIERSSQLMFLRFNVEQKASGEHVVRVRSTENMREPFMTFLLEANWSAGRLVREYTLLLDPPISHTQRDSIAVAPAVVSAPSVTTPRVSPSPAPISGELVYGPVKKDDTLWGIAQKMRPSADVSIQQMMMALLQANPYAFVDGNINRLKSGYVLRIDDPNLLRAMSQAEAAREVSRQTSDWQDRRQQAAGRAPERATPDTASTPTAAVATAPRVEPELKLVTPDEGKADVVTAGVSESDTVAAVRQDLMLALESSAAQRQENEELLKRISTMERQLADMERMLNLKSDDLAILQRQLGEPEQERAQQPGSSVATSDAVTTDVTAQTEATSDPAPVTEQLAAQVEPRAERPTRPVAPPPPPPEPTFMEKLMGDIVMLAIGVGILLVLVVLAVLIIRRRRKGSFQESILSGGTSSMMNAKSTESKETSFLSDLAISGMGAGASSSDEGEVDPLTEADVFMAYGRNQQAEEVLKKALDDNPQRLELTTKLLEVYYNTRDPDEYLALVSNSMDNLKKDDAVWNNVVAMGHELLPDEELFAGADAMVAPEVTKSATHAADDVLDIGLDLDELSAEMEGEAEGNSDLFDLGFDLDIDDDFGTTTKSEKTAPVQQEGSGDSDAFEFDLDMGEKEKSSASESLESDAPDLNLQDDSDELSVVGESENESTPAAEDDFSLDFITDEKDETPESVEASEVMPEIEDESLDLAESELGELDLAESMDLSSDMLSESDNEMNDLDMGDGLGDFGDLDEIDEGMLDESDEIATKLDLAQAYIEMGDAEGARSMLEEVVEAGTAEQKRQAEELLGRI